MNQNLSNPLWSTFQILSNGLDGTFSRERLAKGSGLVWNYGRAEVALLDGERHKSAEKPREKRIADLFLAAENPRKIIAD